MFKYYTSYVLLFTGFTHILCCGLPLLLGFTSLSSTIFYYETYYLDSEFLETTENFLFILTSLLFFTLISSEIFSKRLSSSKENKCKDEHQCDSTNKKIKFNILISIILYTVNFSIFLSEII